jgi:serine/threonine protein kinase
MHGRPSRVDAVAVLDPWPAPPPGWLFDEHLATGGSAHVFAAHRVADGMSAVVKWGHLRGRDARERFAIEAEALATLASPWVPALYDHGVTDAGAPFIAMERVFGETLAAWMAREQDGGSLGDVIAVLDRLACALAGIHARGIVHRDIKPENIVLDGPMVRVLDFGLARRLEATFGPTQDGSMVGTPFYLAPEQVRSDGPIDARADLYAFGTVAFEMLTGRPPFVGNRAAIQYGHTLGKTPRVREERASIPVNLDALIAACMAKSPADRPPSADAVRAGLHSVVQATTLVGVPSAAADRVAPPITTPPLKKRGTRRLGTVPIPESPFPSEPPRSGVAGWTVVRTIARGGFGSVFEVSHPDGRRAALKRLNGDLLSSPDAIARFRREADVIARLRHPSIVDLIDAGVDDGRPYLVMELVEGPDLAAMIKAQGRLETTQVLAIAAPLCDALATAHRAGIVHRDVKASNVVVAPSGRIVLLDFGIAKLLDGITTNDLTVSRQAVGTPACMAPEQIRGEAVDARTDVYGTGALLYHALTGELPFDHPSITMAQYLHLHARRPRASAAAPVPVTVDDVLVRAMAIDPASRFDGPTALLAALVAALS